MPSLRFATSGLHLRAAASPRGVLVEAFALVPPQTLHLAVHLAPQADAAAMHAEAARLLARLPPGLPWPNARELANGLRTLALQCAPSSPQETPAHAP